MDTPNAPPGRPHFLSTPAPPTPGATADVLPAPAGMPSTPPPVVPAAGLRTYLRGRDILVRCSSASGLCSLFVTNGAYVIYDARLVSALAMLQKHL